MKELILFLIKIGGMFGIVFGLLPLMIWGERKGAAYIQNRPGPNRAAVAGFTLAGLFHPLADVIKLMTKEEFIPAQANRVMLILAPCFAMGPALMTFAVVPWGGPITIFDKPEYLQVANLDVGILYVFAISSLGVFGIMLAGWASNNKYSLLGGLRSSAQMLSYEIAMGLSIVGVIMIFHS
ncbi:MAG: NADH-quinone oxidoreductase subunit H, partial [Myxococcales bacterium]|nr:NADH-quinone oxidoreductase subunit H [Myxococcales bacterium]